MTRPKLSSWNVRAWPAAALVCLCFAATLYFFWNGIGPNDSNKYIPYALAWSEQGPQLGGSHWGLRLPIVAPIAASYALFGPSELTSTLPNILYAAGIVAVTYFFARKHLGENAGFACAALLAVSAFFVVVQSEVEVTGAESFFVVLSCWMFVDALSKNNLLRFAAAGLFAGGAWLCRESALFLPASFGLLLILRRPFQPAALAATAGGFALVIGAEMIGYWLAAGDPLYRYRVDFGHRAPGVYVDPEAPGGLFDRLLRPLTHLFSDPVTTPFLILAAACFMAPGFRRAVFAAPMRRTAIVFGTAACVGYFMTAYGLDLKSTRYYPIVAYAPLLVLGSFIGWLHGSNRRRFAAAGALAGLIALNWAAADFRDHDAHAEARYLARYIKESGQSVTTDQVTAARTRILLRFEGFAREEAHSKVISTHKATRAPCGLIYSATAGGSKKLMRPQPEWRELGRAEVRDRQWTHAILDLIPVAGLSPRLAEILKRPAPVTFYQAEPCA